MADTLSTSTTVYAALQPRSRGAQLTAALITVVLGTLLLTLSAKFKVPFWPVPATLQTMVVALIAGTLGWRLGCATVVLYLFEGLTGLPVFAAGGGLPVLIGPTAGFLVGFLAMAFIVGWAADAGLSRRPLQLFGAMILGDAVVFAFGFTWLLKTGLTADAAFGVVQPLIIWDIVKMGFAAATVFGAFALVRRR